MASLWVQEWEESERGWGTRPDGYTVHAKREDVGAFLKEMRAREAETYKGATPDEYSRPCGDPYEYEVVDEELATKVTVSKNGIWGPGRAPSDIAKEFKKRLDEVAKKKGKAEKKAEEKIATPPATPLAWRELPQTDRAKVIDRMKGAAINLTQASNYGEAVLMMAAIQELETAK